MNENIKEILLGILSVLSLINNNYDSGTSNLINELFEQIENLGDEDDE